jgi:hypothetical protein
MCTKSGHTTTIGANTTIYGYNLNIGREAGKVSTAWWIGCRLAEYAGKTMAGEVGPNAAFSPACRGAGSTAGIAIHFAGLAVDVGSTTTDGLEISLLLIKEWGIGRLE